MKEAIRKFIEVEVRDFSDIYFAKNKVEAFKTLFKQNKILEVGYLCRFREVVKNQDGTFRKQAKDKKGIWKYWDSKEMLKQIT